MIRQHLRNPGRSHKPPITGVYCRKPLPAWKRFFKIYYRQEADRPAIEAALARSLLHRRDQVVWREADLCRADLLVEIEATLVAA